LAGRVFAQADSIFQRVLALNRTGEWAQAARLAEEDLSSPSASQKSPTTCLVRVGLLYARVRLGQVPEAKAALAAFDSACARVEIESGFASEVTRLRMELASAVVHAPGADSARPEAANAAADDGLWRVVEPAHLGMNVDALTQHRALCQDTGAALSPTAEPGTRWDYSNEGAQLLSPILDRAAGEPIHEYARKRLFEPLGMRETRLHLDEQHHAWTYADMETTPRDLARIGLLMLQRGVWHERRILSEAWINASTRPSQELNPGYGLLWWLHNDPPGFAAHGHLDTDLHVFPGLDLIVVRMQAKPVAGVAEGTYEGKALPLYRTMVRNAMRR